MTLEYALALAVSTLALVVAKLWARVEKELDACTEDRKSLRALISQHVGTIESR